MATAGTTPARRHRSRRDLASERAYLRTEPITCIREDGGAIEVPLDAYAVGEDGKVGVRGRLVNNQSVRRLGTARAPQPSRRPALLAAAFDPWRRDAPMSADVQPANSAAAPQGHRSAVQRAALSHAIAVHPMRG